MRLSKYFQALRDEGEVIALFGDGKLIKRLDSGYELRGGSAADKTEAREWISMFMHEAVVEFPGACGETLKSEG